MNMTITAVERRNIAGFTTNWVGHGVGTPQGANYTVRLTVILGDDAADKMRSKLLKGEEVGHSVMPEDVVFVAKAD